MAKRIITTENLEEDMKIEKSSSPTDAGRLYRSGEGEDDAEGLY